MRSIKVKGSLKYVCYAQCIICVNPLIQRKITVTLSVTYAPSELLSNLLLLRQDTQFRLIYNLFCLQRII
jgi:hypothetical protein